MNFKAQVITNSGVVETNTIVNENDCVLIDIKDENDFVLIDIKDENVLIDIKNENVHCISKEIYKPMLYINNFFNGSNDMCDGTIKVYTNNINKVHSSLYCNYSQYSKYSKYADNESEEFDFEKFNY